VIASWTPSTQPAVVPDGTTDIIPAMINTFKPSPHELSGCCSAALMLKLEQPTRFPLIKMDTADKGGAATKYLPENGNEEPSIKVPPDETIFKPDPVGFWAMQPAVEPPSVTRGV